MRKPGYLFAVGAFGAAFDRCNLGAYTRWLHGRLGLPGLAGMLWLSWRTVAAIAQFRSPRCASGI